MKLLRSAAAIGLAKKLYDEARKPENQRRISRGRRQGEGQAGASTGPLTEGSGVRRHAGAVNPADQPTSR